MMYKTYFHDKKNVSKNKVQKKTIPLHRIDQKRIVDINKLLNRVKIDKRNETKKIIIFYSLITLAIGFFLTFIMIIK